MRLKVFILFITQPANMKISPMEITPQGIYQNGSIHQ